MIPTKDDIEQSFIHLIIVLSDAVWLLSHAAA